MNTYKSLDLKPFRINTYKKTGGRVSTTGRSKLTASAGLSSYLPHRTSPFYLRAVRGSNQYLATRPLREAFVPVPLTEVRGAHQRTFQKRRLSLVANFWIASTYCGKITEVLALPEEPASFEQAGYFDIDTKVLEPLENPFGPKLLPR
jgi:hypothetical protein